MSINVLQGGLSSIWVGLLHSNSCVPNIYTLYDIMKLQIKKKLSVYHSLKHPVFYSILYI